MSDPLFQFGYGLSYTHFDLGNAQTNNIKLNKGENTTITIPVSNTGKRMGTEVVQIYLRKVNDTTGPLKTLKGFQRVEVDAGKTVESVITLPYYAFEFYNEEKLEMDVTPGAYELLYGNSSSEKDLKIIKVDVQ
jgi:beta-glucosidase